MRTGSYKSVSRQGSPEGNVAASGGYDDVLCRDSLCAIYEAQPPSAIAVVVVAALSFILLSPSSLSSLPFGVIVATAVRRSRPLSPPSTVALAHFVFALAVATTTFLAVDVTSVFVHCVPSPPNEDHRVPPTSVTALVIVTLLC